jgi:hypothetical protein
VERCETLVLSRTTEIIDTINGEFTRLFSISYSWEAFHERRLFCFLEETYME